jgi:hypothetical protein
MIVNMHTCSILLQETPILKKKKKIQNSIHGVKWSKYIFSTKLGHDHLIQN